MYNHGMLTAEVTKPAKTKGQCFCKRNVYTMDDITSTKVLPTPHHNYVVFYFSTLRIKV